MTQTEWNLDRDGFCLMHHAVDAVTIQRLLAVFDDVFEDQSQSVLARSSRGHGYQWHDFVRPYSRITISGD